MTIRDDEAIRRVSVVGNSGSGKTRLSQQIAVALGVSHFELDAIYHLADWTPIDPSAFADTLEELTSGDGWVIDGNYRTVVVEGPVWRRADTVVWIDLPRRAVMWQVIRRTLVRMIRRQELWNGNRESLRNLCSWDPEKSIIRWAWTQHAKYHERYCTASRSPAFAHINFVRLTSHDEIEKWLESIGTPD